MGAEPPDTEDPDTDQPSTEQPDTQNSVLMSELDAHSFRRWSTRDPGPVLVPVGALEQHGPHLPLGTDAILSTTIATSVARRTGGLVAQPFTYGYKSQQKSGGGDHLTGTTSLDAAALIGLTRSVTGSLLRQGIGRIVFVNGHFENYQFLYEGIDLALGDLGIGSGDDRGVLLLSYWDYVSEATLERVYPGGFPGWAIEHGGVLETSLMLHLRPSLVAMDRALQHPAASLPRFDRLPVVPERTPESGCLSAPAGSDAAKGELLLDQIVDDLSADIISEFGPAAVQRGLTSAV